MQPIGAPVRLLDVGVGAWVAAHAPRVAIGRELEDMAGRGPDTTEVIALSGHLDGRCSPELRELITAHLARHADEGLRLDMSDVESLDITALRLLAAVAVRLQRDGHRLVLLDRKS